MLREATIGRRAWRFVGAGVVLAALLAPMLPTSRAGEPVHAAERSGQELYRAACATCHGNDGRGAPSTRVAFDVELPDFTDCSFATREPDGDWVGVAHGGGPTRGFDRLMPAFGDAITVPELERTIDYIRTFCADSDWPSGDLNLPRPMFTEKAFIEDEAVVTVGVTVEGRVGFDNELVFETRFGASNQLEIKVPFGFGEPRAGSGPWTSGLGDIGLAVKRAMLFSKDSGTIFSGALEVLLPTGNAADGYGKGTTTFEPFLAFGQLLGPAGFLHLQVGLELPVDAHKAEREIFWRLAYGHTFTQGPFGRAWSPMIEVLGKSELEGGATPKWDLVPQLQVALNTRQHVLANLAVRVPLNERQGRGVEILVYLLWDWFDGGFLEGW